MEAATPLRQPHVRVLGDCVAIDGLVVEDECAVRLVREREQNGDDPVKTVRDAVEIGARVLDREQAGANAEFVKTEFEKASTRGAARVHRPGARRSPSSSRRSSPQVFGEEDGQLAKELERRFGDGSAVSVQNRVREAGAARRSSSRARTWCASSPRPTSATRSPTSRRTVRVLKIRQAAPARTHPARAAREDGRAREAAPGAAAREGEARGGRGRARARQRQGPHLRGGGGRRRRRDRARTGRRGRGRGRPQGGHRQGR